MKLLPFSRRSAAALAWFLAGTNVLAQSPAPSLSVDPLTAAVQSAITTNPDVTARYNAYRASIDAIDVARGAYLPRVDLSATVGLA